LRLLLLHQLLLHLRSQVRLREGEMVGVLWREGKLLSGHRRCEEDLLLWDTLVLYRVLHELRPWCILLPHTGLIILEKKERHSC
jgi:hypothetical protein